MAVTEPLASFGKPPHVEGQNTGLSGETAMEKKLMFVAFGYLLLLAALDAGVAAVIVSG
jgi:hypothetical protein